MTDKNMVDMRHLAGVAELAELFRVSRSVISNWAARRPQNGFPRKVMRLASGPIYNINDVLSWYETYAPAVGVRPGAAPVQNADGCFVPGERAQDEGQEYERDTEPEPAPEGVESVGYPLGAPFGRTVDA